MFIPRVLGTGVHLGRKGTQTFPTHRVKTTINKPPQVPTKTTLESFLKGQVPPIGIDFSRSQGSHLFVTEDQAPDQGRLVIDCNGGLAVSGLGYNPEELLTPKVRETVARLAANNTSVSLYRPPEYSQAMNSIYERLAEPNGFDRVFPIANGVNANGTALTMAFSTKRAWLEKRGLSPDGQLVAFKMGGGFHGRGPGMGSATTTTYPEKDGKTSILNRDMPNFDGWATITPPDLSGSDQATLAEFEQQILQTGPNRVACFLIEDGLQCGRGDIPFSKTLMEGIHNIAEQHGIVIIADGVQTGVYSTGEPCAWQAFDFPQPHLWTTAKKLGLGLVLAKKGLEVPAFDNPMSVNSTFGGGGVSVYMAAEILKAMQDRHVGENAKLQGKKLVKGLTQLANKYPWLSKPRGVGLMGVALDVHPSKKLTAAEVLTKANEECKKRGLLTMPSTAPRSYVDYNEEKYGTPPDLCAFRLRPPLTITDSDTESILNIVQESIESANELLKA